MKAHDKAFGKPTGSTLAGQIVDMFATKTVQTLLSSNILKKTTYFKPYSEANILNVYDVVQKYKFEFPIINFKLYLFYNNNTRLQIGHEVILLGGE